MQIKTTLRFHLTPVRKAIIKTPPTTGAIKTGVGKDVGKKEGTLIHCWWECRLVQPLWKTICKILKNLNIDLPYDPAIPLLEIYPKYCNTG
jgi:hypothetical protein